MPSLPTGLVLLREVRFDWHRPATYSCSLRHIRLQPSSHTVAASLSYGCSLRHIRLQVRFDWHHKAQPALRLRTRPEAVVAAKDAFSRRLLVRFRVRVRVNPSPSPSPNPNPNPTANPNQAAA